MIALYGRSETYNSTVWKSVGGSVDSSYSSYVSEYSYFPKIKYIRLEDGNELDAPHFWAVLNTSFNNQGDLGGWAGDLVTYQADLNNDSSLVFPAKSFGYQDWISDADAYTIYKNSSSDILAGMKSYYEGNLTEEYRVKNFVTDDDIKTRFNNSKSSTYLKILKSTYSVSSINEAAEQMQSYLDKYLPIDIVENEGIKYNVYTFDMIDKLNVKVVKK